MNAHLLKTGVCSVVLGPGHYGKFINITEDTKEKLLKITKVTDKHNEFTHLSIIRSIENYNDYYSIPDDILFVLKPSHKFYTYIEYIVKLEQMTIFNGPLTYFYIDNAGDKELLETINRMYDNNDFTFWKSYSQILKFAVKIMHGLNFLHEKQLCHLDIKPENIMVNTANKTFKIIDFGFCSIEPFDDYLHNIRGTPGYFPQYFKNVKIHPWFPKIEANDMILIDNQIPMVKNRKLVYKVDSYCFGRILYLLNYIYTDNVTICCYNYETQTNNKINKINKLIDSLMEADVFKRLTIKQALDLIES